MGGGQFPIQEVATDCQTRQTKDHACHAGQPQDRCPPRYPLARRWRQARLWLSEMIEHQDQHEAQRREGERSAAKEEGHQEDAPIKGVAQTIPETDLQGSSSPKIGGETKKHAKQSCSQEK